MLESLRSGASSWIAKGLLGLLVLSFAVWGIGGDYLRGIGSQVPIEVGDVQVSANDFVRAYQRELEGLRQRFGGNLDPDLVKRLGLVDLTAERIVQAAVLDQAVRDMGLDIPDDLLREKIRKDPSFQSPLNQGFDQQLYIQQLRRFGYSEQQFIHELRSGLLRDYLVQSLVAGLESPPKSEVSVLLRYREELRVAKYVLLLNSSTAAPAEPSDDAIATFHQDHAAEFTAPEYRSLAILHLSAADLAPTISVSEADIAEEYEARAADFGSPATRTVDQLVFLDEDSAAKARQRIIDGADMTTVGKEDLGLEPSDIDLGEITKLDLPSEIADAVFALKKGDLSQPLQSSFGWHLVQVKNAKEETVKTLAEVRDTLRKDIATRRAEDQLYKVSAGLEDTLAGGATLEEAAKANGLSIKSLPSVDRSGKDPSGKPVENLPDLRQILDVAFDTLSGEISPLSETEAGSFFIVRVESVTPEALKPIASVRGEIIAAWKAEKRKEANKLRAESLVKKIEAGSNLASEAASLGVTVATSDPIKRNGDGSPPQFSPPLIGSLFASAIGGASTAASSDGKAQVVAVVELIKEPEPNQTDDAEKQFQNTLKQGIARDILGVYQAALRQRVKVSVDRPSLDALAQ